jgi:hypothetical protein
VALVKLLLGHRPSFLEENLGDKALHLVERIGEGTSWLIFHIDKPLHFPSTSLMFISSLFI